MATARRQQGLSFPKLVLSASALLALVLFGLSRRSASIPLKVTIPPGASIPTVAVTLKRAGIIRSTTLFRLTTQLFGHNASAIKSGRYIMPRGAPYGRLLDQLRTGAGQYRRLTIPEGWSILQIAALMRDSLQIPVDSLIAATRDSARRARMQTPARDVEGYLFPATYEFSDGISGAAIVDSMLAAFDKRWKPTWDTALARDGRSRHAVVTLASIVEKEARRADERPKIAAVYLNRLREGMRLQADPTVLYAMGIVAKRVLYEDLKFESPYNTYRVSGLPPGPIASPGTASLVAAIEPAQSDAMFFVAFPDGHSEFTRTFAEHSVAVAASRVARDAATSKR
jgi:UPF0755 protein